MQSFQKHWIGQTPMEAELTINGRTVPGLAPFDHGNAALGRAGGPTASAATRRFNPGLFHTGCGGGPTGQGERTIFGLTTSIQSIGEGNYGRLGAGQQQRYTHALAETMFAEPATGGTPDEQPGAMPEIFPSPDSHPTEGREHRPLLDLPLDVHAGVGQLRHGLGRRAPVARRAARPRPRTPRGRPAGAVGRSDRRPRHPARATGDRRGRREARLDLARRPSTRVTRPSRG